MTQPYSHTARLSALGLGLTRGANVLFSGLSFRVSPGDMLWVGGANGIGKTSLLKCVAGLLRPDSGEIAFDPDRPRIAYQGHRDAHKPGLTAFENLCFWHGVLGGDVSVQTAMQRAGIWHLKDQRAKSLSAGQSRRLSLARLLIHDAPLWIMDEPFAALDLAGQDLVKSMLADHIAKNGCALLASHGGAVSIGGNTRLLQFTRPKEEAHNGRF